MSKVKQIQELIDNLSSEEKGQLSDGSHSFNELYHHRFVLWQTVLKAIKTTQPNLPMQVLNYPRIYKCKKHYDGTGYEGWFLSLVIFPDDKQISYHLPDSEWDNTTGESKEKAPVVFDGHTAEDVLSLIKSISFSKMDMDW